MVGRFFQLIFMIMFCRHLQMKSIIISETDHFPIHMDTLFQETVCYSSLFHRSSYTYIPKLRIAFIYCDLKLLTRNGIEKNSTIVHDFYILSS